MSQSSNPLLSIAASLLILLALFGYFSRNHSDRIKPLPALIVGHGLIITSALGRRYRRRKLLIALKKIGSDPC